MVSNYHTHSRYCDGNDSLEELVCEAIAYGCPEIGFSGHSYTFFDESYCMSKEGTCAYQREVDTLRKKYAHKIHILLGTEQDYFSQESTDAYDYVIGSVHYVHKDGKYLPVDESKELQVEAVDCHYNGDFYAFIEDYYLCVADIYKQTHCDIVGHFDLITKFNDNETLFKTSHPRYLAAVQHALDALLDTPAFFEINTGGMARGYKKQAYPAFDIVDWLIKHNKKLIFSSDCHDKKDLLFAYHKIAGRYSDKLLDFKPLDRGL